MNFNMTKVAMIGCGKLGLPCAEVMSKYYDVIGYDIKQVQNTQIPITHSIEQAVEGRDIIFIAVPTPHDPAYSGSSPIADLSPKDFDYSIVKKVLSKVDNLCDNNQLIVLISTVLPGTTRKEFYPIIKNARFIYNPYLIAMGSVEWDMVNPECLIIGTEDGSKTGDAELLVKFYKPIMENDPKINIGTWDEAESIKIFYNTFISTKLALVNMIQDVAEANGNINVDVVTDALKAATQRITGPKYLTAGMGDGGACHPRDNIALRYLAQNLNLGYDIFHAIMISRDKQAERIADRLVKLSEIFDLEIVIHGRAYKPNVPYTDGSYSELIGHYLKGKNIKFSYVDPNTGDDRNSNLPALFFLAHNAAVTYDRAEENATYCPIPNGSVVLDPWRSFTTKNDVVIFYYGNTRNNQSV